MATTAPETTQDVRGDGADRIGLPSATGDFYDIASLLSEEDSQIVGRVRAFAERTVAPIINHYWARAEFPFELIPEIASLGVAGLSYTGYGLPRPRGRPVPYLGPAGSAASRGPDEIPRHPGG